MKIMTRKLIVLFVFMILISSMGVYLVKFVFEMKRNTSPSTQTKSQSKIVYAAPLVTAPEDESLQNGPFHCPTSVTFCQKQSSFANNALSVNVSKGSAIYAVFGGKVDVLSSIHPQENGKTEEYTTIIVTNAQRGLEGMYYFKGDGKSSKVVNEGDIIATASGQPIVFMNNKSLVFSMTKATKSGDIVVPLSTKDFQK